jgi:hypothetical protein
VLNSVPTNANFSKRQVVLRHPNAWDCLVYRKQVKRQEIIGGQPSTMGDFPTLGGLGVLDSEDEADFDYVELGEGKLRFLGPFQQSDTVDRGDAQLQAQLSEAQIEAIAEPTDPAYFTVEKHDIVIAMPGGGIGLAYEVAQVQGSINIPPYNRRYLLSPRDDLHYLDPFASEPAAEPDPPPPPVGPNTPAA